MNIGDFVQLGDVVRLRTGGPEMVVESMNPTDKAVTCIWFRVDNGARYGELARSTLGVATLDLVRHDSRPGQAPRAAEGRLPPNLLENIAVEFAERGCFSTPYQLTRSDFTTISARTTELLAAKQVTP